MADFTTTITDAGVLDADELTIFSNYVIFAATPELVVDQAVTVRESGNTKTFQWAKYTALAVPSALSDGVDPASTPLSDSSVTVTPTEEGNVVTLAKLADIQSGLKANAASLRLCGFNLGLTKDVRGITTLEGATTNVIYPNDVAATTSLSTADVLDRLFANRLYNKLARANVPGISGTYIGIAHDDCLHDLRQDASNGGWIDVSKYADPQSALRNEVGQYAGIRWLRSGNTTVTDGGGAGNIDSYEVQVVGDNALGYAANEEPHLVLSGPYDKLLRFVNIGWFGIFAYKMIDESNAVTGDCASTVGANS